MSRSLTDVLDKLYAQEINCSITSFWDSGYEVGIGDEINGFVAGATFHPDPRHGRPLSEMAEWLESTAATLYPPATDSDVRRICDGNPVA